MKTTILVGLVVVGVGAYTQFTRPFEAWKSEPEVVEVTKEVETDVLSKRIQDAVEAAMPEIEANADSEYKNAVEAAEAAYKQALEKASTTKAETIAKKITEVEDEQKALFIQEIEATISSDAAY